jgi:hypothetical protein
MFKRVFFSGRPFLVYKDRRLPRQPPVPPTRRPSDDDVIFRFWIGIATMAAVGVAEWIFGIGAFLAIPAFLVIFYFWVIKN